MFLSTWFFLPTIFAYLVFHLLWHQHKKRILPECIPILPTLPLIGSVHHLLQDRDLLQLIRKWHLKLGPIFGLSLFGIPAVVLNEPSYLQKILSSSEPGHLTRPSLHTSALMPPKFHVGVLPSNGEKWKSQRMIVGKGFTHEALKSYLPIFNLHGKRLISELKNILPENEGEAITQLQDLLVHTALRININVITGNNVKGDDESSQFLQDFHFIEDTVANFVTSPWFAIPPFSWWYRTRKAEVGKKAGNCERFLQKMLKQCKNGEEDPSFQSMMRVMLNQGVCEEDLISECLWLSFAGSNTVGLTLLFTLFNLALHVDHQEKCREEVDGVFSEVEEKGGNLGNDDIFKLLYLDRCIKESQRMFSVIPFSTRQLQSSFKLDENVELSKGTFVFASHDAVHINPKVFPNPEKFDPDRFLPENIRTRSSYAFTPFSAGRRDCIGAKFAMLEMKVVLAWVLRHFELETLDSYDNVECQYNVAVSPKRLIRFRLKERKL
ncbi:unnamed protein product [Orchesella dallaii]|uniref:Cytochrome P450 n=1 Tax=Orchesella dallaii TaxID=48710 RepID=A0ABP1QZW7_9HEXA